MERTDMDKFQKITKTHEKKKLEKWRRAAALHIINPLEDRKQDSQPTGQDGAHQERE